MIPNQLGIDLGKFNLQICQEIPPHFPLGFAQMLGNDEGRPQVLLVEKYESGKLLWVIHLRFSVDVVIHKLSKRLDEQAYCACLGMPRADLQPVFEAKKVKRYDSLSG
ncbi:hypothetical protein D3C77_595500 [compost metagenome]